MISIGTSAFRDCTSLTRVTIPASVYLIDENAFQGCPIPCIYSWDPTITRSVEVSAGFSMMTMTACPCDDGYHLVDYVCTANEPSQYPTAVPTDPIDRTAEIVGGTIPAGIFIIGIVIYVVLRLRKRKQYKQLKVHPVLDGTVDDQEKDLSCSKLGKFDSLVLDEGQGKELSKFDSPVQYFKLGSEKDYMVTNTIIIIIIIVIVIIIIIIMFMFKDGITKKVGVLYRSMEEECTTNDNGKLFLTFITNYITIITITIIR